MRALIHVTAVLGLAAVAIAVGRWLRDPEPGGDDRLDLNRASITELRRLPGIGHVAAERIVEEREENGPYRSVGDLVRVGARHESGIGPLCGAQLCADLLECPVRPAPFASYPAQLPFAGGR